MTREFMLPYSKADVELIVALAETVMGAAARRDARGWTTEYRGLLGGNYLHVHSDDSPYILKTEGWNPLESDADVFMVVEAMEKFCCDFMLEKSGTNWTAQFGGVSRKGLERRRVICEAALAAIGGVPVEATNAG